VHIPRKGHTTLIISLDEPLEAAWASFGAFCSHEEVLPCEDEGCTHAPREVVGFTAGPNGRIEITCNEEEHIAGPKCTFTAGYSGWDITVDEMKVRSLCPGTWSIGTDQEALGEDLGAVFVSKG